jgi:hypothetical protein
MFGCVRKVFVRRE